MIPHQPVRIRGSLHGAHQPVRRPGHPRAAPPPPRTGREPDRKDCGLERLPFTSFAAKAAWIEEMVLCAADLLAWCQTLLFEGELAVAEPRTFRYRILHIAARLIRSTPTNMAATPRTLAMDRRSARRLPASLHHRLNRRRTRRTRHHALTRVPTSNTSTATTPRSPQSALTRPPTAPINRHHPGHSEQPRSSDLKPSHERSGLVAGVIDVAAILKRAARRPLRTV